MEARHRGDTDNVAGLVLDHLLQKVFRHLERERERKGGDEMGNQLCWFFTYQYRPENVNFEHQLDVLRRIVQIFIRHQTGVVDLEEKRKKL